MAIELIYSNIFQCDHRLTSFCQLDLQEAGKLTLKFQAFAVEIFLESF